MSFDKMGCGNGYDLIELSRLVFSVYIRHCTDLKRLVLIFAHIVLENLLDDAGSLCNIT
jgi:hypothetical protein